MLITWCKIGNEEMQYGICKSKNPRIEKYEILNLQTICYINPSLLEVLSYKVGLDPVATSYVVG